MRAADLIAKRLYDAGCRWAFGLPGGEVLTLIDALEAAGIRFVLAQHENAAGFMAEGTYHRTGAPGVLVATVGPGALNCINVIENAREDRVPLMVLTGCLSNAEAQVYTHQVLDQSAVFRTVAKASFTLDAQAADVIIDKAIGIATEAQPGPVHIDVPISVADAPATDSGVRRPSASPVAPVGPNLARARAALAQARRPLIVAGVDAVNDGAGPALVAMAEALGAPVITSYKAKGLMPEDHPLSLGGAGLSPKADGILMPLVAQADVILGAGYDPIEMRLGWQNPWDPATQTIIDVTAAPNHHYMHQASINIIGDCAASLVALMPKGVETPGWDTDAPAQTRAALRDAFAAPDTWGPGQIIATCQRVLPDDTLATADSGAHRILLSQMWQAGFERALVQSSGFCTMGCAVPLAIGQKLASPERPVVAFTGDAGLKMIAGELSTAVDLGVAPIVVVFVDQSLALIELKQRQRQLDNNGVDFGYTDYAALARAFGGYGETVRSVPELETALTAAASADRLTLIAAEFDRKAYDGTF